MLHRQVETIDYEAEAKEKAEEILAQANAEADEIRKAAREEADEIRKNRHRNRDRQKVWNRECRKVLRFMMQS